MSLESGVDAYSEDPVVRALMQLVPGGSSVDAFIGAVAAKLGRERFERFVLDVYDEVQQLDDRKLDREFLNSPAGFDFFLEVVERVVRTQDEEKLAALRHAFINGSTVGVSSGPSKDVMVRLVGDLTAAHVRILRAIEVGQQAFMPGQQDDEGENPDAYAVLPNVRTTLADLSDSDFDVVLSDLFRQQLVVSWWEGKYGGMGRRSPRRDRLTLSSFGAAFVQFISSPRGSH